MSKVRGIKQYYIIIYNILSRIDMLVYIVKYYQYLQKKKKVKQLYLLRQVLNVCVGGWEYLQYLCYGQKYKMFLTPMI